MIVFFTDARSLTLLLSNTLFKARLDPARDDLLVQLQVLVPQPLLHQSLLLSLLQADARVDRKGLTAFAFFKMVMLQ